MENTVSSSQDVGQWAQTEVHSPLMTTILEHIENGEEKEVSVIMDSKSISDQLKQVAWDLVPKVCDFLTQQNHHDNPKVTSTAEAVLVRLAQRAKPKEVLLVLLEQADTFTDDVKFKALLPAIQQCLLQLPSRRGHSIAVARETLYAHVQTLPLPKDHDLEGQERKLLETDDDICRINDVTRALLEFIKPLAENISIKNSENDLKIRDKLERSELISLIMKVLAHPMACTDMTHSESEKTVEPESRMNGERAMTLLAILQPDFLQLLRNLKENNERIDCEKKAREAKTKRLLEAGDVPDEMDACDVEEKHAELGLAVLAYLAFGERRSVESLPQVYTPRYVLEEVLPYALHLLSCTQRLVVHKGAILLTGALGCVPDCSLSAELLEWHQVKEVLQSLLHVMVQNESKEVRTAAVKVLPLWMSRFDTRGRYHFINLLMMTEANPSVVGYAIQLLKDQIDNALKMERPGEHFVGLHLEKILNSVFALPDGAKTDLLEQSDRIMAALNLLRYLILRDNPSNNVSGIWSYVACIEKNYLETLRTGINFSKAHYELELKKLKDGTSELLMPDKDGEGMPEMKFNVGGEDLPKLAPHQQTDMLHTAIHTFEMMESVLGRVGELIAQQKRV